MSIKERTADTVEASRVFPSVSLVFSCTFLFLRVLKCFEVYFCKRQIFWDRGIIICVMEYETEAKKILGSD